jgi:hypothetical protein
MDQALTKMDQAFIDNLSDPVMDLDFYLTREELMRQYTPTDDSQRELLGHIADVYDELRESSRLRKLVARKGVSGLSPQELVDFKALMHRALESEAADLHRLKSSAVAAPLSRGSDRRPCAHRILRGSSSRRTRV